MIPSIPVLKDLVLIGGGHSHIAVVKRFGMQPVPGVRVTLISRDVETPYSGMLPGVVAGHYARDEAHIDLEVLCRFANVRPVFDEAIGIDLATRAVRFRSRPPIPYDVLSINIGSTPATKVPGSATHAIPVKPIDGFLADWSAVEARLLTATGRTRIAVVGGGAGGVELTLAIEYRMRSLLRGKGSTARLEYHLFTDQDAILPTHNRRVRRMFERALHQRDISVHAGHAVTEVAQGILHTDDGRVHAADEILWTTQAVAVPWLREAGLNVDEGGFVRVSSTLQSISHPEVFAAGDAAAMIESPRPKSGVFAVRQGRPLARNLRRALLGQPLRPYRPQRRALSLISTGNHNAVASRGLLACQGRWVWRWKNWIDRRFMRRYQDLPEMEGTDAPKVPEGLADRDAMAALSSLAVRCGGCGAKVAASVLARALLRLNLENRSDVVIGLDAPDDAAVVRMPDGTAVVHTMDFFRAIVDDPYVFSQIAANHALGDVYAMGAEPQSALALVTIPYAPEAKVEDALTQLLSGALVVLREAGVALVGGHTSESAELGMGFAVNGVADPNRILRKAGLRPDDRLILTKAIGTGTLFAADMRHRAKGRWISAAIQSMTQSNRDAARCLLMHGATACTDVTGFGLIGHLVEMLKASDVDAAIDLGIVPMLDGAEEMVRAGFLSSLQPENIRLRRAVTNAATFADDARFALLFDPQTAGGLLAGVPAARAELCVNELRACGYAATAIIGRIVERGDGPEMITLHV